jgi:cell wall-associated NlpC family hydrolase
MKVLNLVFLCVVITGWSAQAQTQEEIEKAIECARNSISAERETEISTAISTTVSIDTISLNAIPVDSIAQEILAYSAKFLGAPYRYATRGPKTFDCSGFTSFVFNHFGYKLSPGSKYQFTQGKRVGLKEIQPGDLIFFTSAKSKGGPGHVGIVVENYGNGNLRFIHASSYRSGGVRYDELTSGYYARRYITGLRVL